MSNQEENAYILGTDEQELYRLGLQHQVWASEAQEGWKLAQFSAGQTILDLGCGPGFCTKELAFITGPTGKVIGIDLSESYIKYLNKTAELHHLNIEGIVTDFNEMKLEEASLDGMYCRWALAWLPNPKEILAKVLHALKPGGRMVIHEYYDWSTFQTEPNFPSLTKAIKAALKSFKDSESEIDIGRELPRLAEELGINILSIRPMAKLATPKDATWQWPRSFFYSYFPRLIEAGYLTQDEASAALAAFDELENKNGATIFCPMMIEIVAEKKHK
ncbi:MAG: methyltransferase domain-containing protein [Saprospiraceae bacterium]